MNRRFYKGSNAVFATGVFCMILVFVYAIVQRHDRKFDATGSKLYTLSSQTRQVMAGLEKDIKFLCFYSDAEPDREEVAVTMSLYSDLSPRFTYEFIDPDKKPYIARQHDVNMSGSIIAIANGREEKLMSPKENEITNLIIKLTRDEERTLYFVKGHGERSYENQEKPGLSLVKDILVKQGMKVEGLSLATADTLPAEGSLVIIAGPQTDYMEEELDFLDTYVRSGGNLLLLLDPEKNTSLNGFLAKYGIEVGNNMVVDKMSRVFGGDYLVPIILQYQLHPITKNFTLYSFFPTARTVSAAKDQPEGVKALSLALSTPGKNSWAETDMDMLRQGQARFDEGADTPGPVSVCAVAEVSLGNAKSPDAQEKEDTEKAKDSARIAVFGDTDFASNAYINLYGNKDFFLNTVNWLAEQENLIAISPREQTNQPIVLTPQQARLVFLLSVVFLPGLIVAAGLGVYFQRRAL